MPKKEGIRLRPNRLITGAGLATLESDTPEPGLLWCFEQVAWEIDKATSGGNTRARLYIKGHGYNHYIKEQDNPTAAALYTYNENPIYIFPGERLVLEIDQAQANTTALMNILGYREILSD